MKSSARTTIAALLVAACSRPIAGPGESNNLANWVVLAERAVVEVGQLTLVDAHPMYLDMLSQHLDAGEMTWTVADPELARVESVAQGHGFSHDDDFVTQVASIRGVSAGATRLTVVSVRPGPAQATADLYVLPVVTSFELRSTRDTIWAGETAFVSIVATFSGFSGDPDQFLLRPYADIQAESCSGVCSARATSSGPNYVAVTANGLYGGSIVITAWLGARTIRKSIVVYAEHR